MITGVDELQRNMAALSKKFGEEVAKAAVQGGQMVRSTAIRSIQTVSQGSPSTRYRAGGGAYNHVTSRERDAPNTDTGALVRSIMVEVRADDVYVGTSIEYAPYLEHGTINMTPRPWLLPALEENRPLIKKLFGAAVSRVIK